MPLTVFLDTGPLGLLTNPRRSPETIAALKWAMALLAAGHPVRVPAIADYEVRRELERAGKQRGLAALDAWNAAYPGRYLPLSDSALRLAATLWARSRSSGRSTADPKELDGDVLIAAQALTSGIPPTDFVVATGNLGHLGLFVPVALWFNIHP